MIINKITNTIKPLTILIINIKIFTTRKVHILSEYLDDDNIILEDLRQRQYYHCNL